MAIYAVETFGALVKIEYLDGSSEEVNSGVYERKNVDGDTVEQRAATQADIDRLTQLSVDFEVANPPSTEPVVDVEIIGEAIEIEYADGTKESIQGIIYERKDSNNETIIERAATEADATRFADLADQFGGVPDPVVADPPAPGITLTGTEGDDEIRGTAGSEQIDGLGGNDELRGRGGDDTVNGGAGDDEVRGEGGNDAVNGGDGNDLARGGTGNDIVSGGAGNDRVKGHAGNDTLFGGDGSDKLDGGIGDDVIDGGAGFDRYEGNAGADTFVFGVDGSLDRIDDFQSGVDLIDLTAFGLADGAAALAAASQKLDYVMIDLGDGDRLKLDNVLLTDLNASDFIV